MSCIWYIFVWLDWLVYIVYVSIDLEFGGFFWLLMVIRFSVCARGEYRLDSEHFGHAPSSAKLRWTAKRLNSCATCLVRWPRWVREVPAPMDRRSWTARRSNAMRPVTSSRPVSSVPSTWRWRMHPCWFSSSTSSISVGSWLRMGRCPMSTPTVSSSRRSSCTATPFECASERRSCDICSTTPSMWNGSSRLSWRPCSVCAVTSRNPSERMVSSKRSSPPQYRRTIRSIWCCTSGCIRRSRRSRTCRTDRPWHLLVLVLSHRPSATAWTRDGRCSLCNVWRRGVAHRVCHSFFDGIYIVDGVGGRRKPKKKKYFSFFWEELSVLSLL